MKNRMIDFVLGAVALAAPALAQGGQTGQLPAPPPVEKELAARASNVTEVTLGKNMLAFAAKVMNGKDKDEAETRQLIEGLEGIYVREYEFDKEGQFSPDEVDQLRKYFETSEWSPMVHERDRKNSEIDRRDGEAGERRIARHVHPGCGAERVDDRADSWAYQHGPAWAS